MIILKLLFLFLVTTPFCKTFSQNNSAVHSHEKFKNEIAIANSPVYFIKDKAFGYGIHIHYIRNISDKGFGVGASLEKVFGKFPHNSVGLIATFRPIENWDLNLAPSLTFEDFQSGPTFALHFETTYDVFKIKNIDIGPAFELGYESEGIHISLGIHVCYCF